MMCTATAPQPMVADAPFLVMEGLGNFLLISVATVFDTRFGFQSYPRLSTSFYVSFKPL